MKCGMERGVMGSGGGFENESQICKISIVRTVLKVLQKIIRI